MMMKIACFLLIQTLISCGADNAQQASIQPNPLSPKSIQTAMLLPVDVPNSDGSVIKSRTVLDVGVGGSHKLFSVTGSQTIPVSVTNAASTTVVYSTANFVIPAISTAVLDCGSLSISQLSDNNLMVCGTNGKTACTSAVIRIYTTGVAGAGVYNAAGGYGAPLSAGLNSPLSTVGLSSGNAAVVQTVSIPSTTHVLTASAFGTPTYKVQADFSNAGAGTYSTSLVLEYVLLP